MPHKMKHVIRTLSAWLIYFCLAMPALAFEPPRYDIKADLDAALKKITAQESVTFTNNTDKPVHEVYFHIYPNRQYTREEKDFMMRYAAYFKINPFPDGFQTGKVDIKSVALGEGNTKFAIEGDDKTLLKVLLTNELKPGESVRATINFDVIIPHAYGRFGWNQDVIALSRWYPILSVLDQNGWANHPFYPFHRPFYSDAAYYDVSLTVAAKQVVIHSGQLTGETKNPSGTKTLQISSPLPIRDFSLALSPKYRWYEMMLGDVKIKSYFLENDNFYVQEAMGDAYDTLKYYTENFGPYPYKEFNIAPVYLGYGGEQSSNMIFIDTRVYRLPKFLMRYFDFLISHETGHQWFYNLVGVDGFKEMWLEEGVNSYFNLQYLEDKYGKNAEIVELPEYLKWLLPNVSFRRGRDYRYKLIARTTLDQPVTGELSSFTEPASIFSITYGKGSVIVAMLRHLIGDEAFKKVFARIFEEYRFKNISTRDLIEICRKETGKDLTWFFDEWLKTAKKCDFAVEGASAHKVTLKNRGEIKMPVEVEVEFASGQKTKVVWDAGKNIDTINVEGKGNIKRVTIDPGEETLDIDRTNNTWPRILNIKPVPVYLGLYDIPIFLPDNSYNLVAGPELANNGIGLKTSLQKPYDQNVYAASDYDFSDKLLKSRLGYQLNNVGNSLRTAGFELFNTTDYDNGEEDLAGGKAYIRQELWPASYGLTDINDHVTAYLMRNRSLNPSPLTGLEDSRNTSYLRKNEAIIGTTLHLGKAETYPDPSQGYKLDALLESSNHMLGATQYFYRGSMDWAFYQAVTAKTKMALRLKYGWGYPLDKSLYELGGMDGLRGYDRKTLRGARLGLTSLEYRFPIKENLKIYFPGNVFGLEAVSGVIFVDAGQSWYNDIADSKLKKDAGFGLRATVNIGSFLEKVIVRLDVAEPINDSQEDTHYWFGVGHSF